MQIEPAPARVRLLIGTATALVPAAYLSLPFTQPDPLATACLIGAYVLFLRHRITLPLTGASLTAADALLLALIPVSGPLAALTAVLLGGFLMHRCERPPWYRSLYNTAATALAVAAASALDLLAERLFPASPAAELLAIAVGYWSVNTFAFGLLFATLATEPLRVRLRLMLRVSWEHSLLEVSAAAAAVGAYRLGNVPALLLLIGTAYLILRVFHRVQLNAELLNRLPIGVATWDREGRCTFANEAAAQLFGLPACAWRGRGLGEFGLSGAGAEGGVRQERVDWTPAGEGSRPVEVTYYPEVKDGLFSGMLTVFRDLSDAIERERNARLAAVGRVASRAAHEIKNPLTAARGFVQLAGRELPPERLQWFRVVLQELDYVSSIVDDLLGLARPNRLERQLIRTCDLFDELLSLNEAAATERGVRILHLCREEGRCPPPIALDRRQMKQVLRNLVQNSVEALPAGGVIVLEAVRRDEELVLVVRDNGPGIPHDRLERIFEPFYTTKEWGTGLGLSVCRQVVEAHGGRIEVESAPGVGTAFTLHLPVVATPVELAR